MRLQLVGQMLLDDKQLVVNKEEHIMYWTNSISLTSENAWKNNIERW